MSTAFHRTEVDRSLNDIDTPASLRAMVAALPTDQFQVRLVRNQMGAVLIQYVQREVLKFKRNEDGTLKVTESRPGDFDDSDSVQTLDIDEAAELGLRLMDAVKRAHSVNRDDLEPLEW